MKVIHPSSWREVPVSFFEEEILVWNSDSRLNGFTRRTFSRNPHWGILTREIIQVWSSADKQHSFNQEVLGADAYSSDFTRFTTHAPNACANSETSYLYREEHNSLSQVSTRMAVPSKMIQKTGGNSFRPYDYLKGDLTCLCYHTMMDNNSSISRWGVQLARAPASSDSTTILVENTMELLA